MTEIDDGTWRRKLGVHEYFRRALQRDSGYLPPVEGDLVHAGDRLQARYYLDIVEGRVEAIEYRCTTCVVFVAYCEWLAEKVLGSPIYDALQIKSAALISAFPDVPSYKCDRAPLAIRALRSALHRCTRVSAAFR